MYLRPAGKDLETIGQMLGRIVLAFGVLHLVPAALALVLAEWNTMTALLTGGAISVTAGSVAMRRFRTTRRLQWNLGLVAIALAWLIVPLFAGIALLLSGHYGSYFDAVFDAMSGITTTGLTLVQDLDHLPLSLNLWRHILQFAGGQGAVIVFLTLFAPSSTQAGLLYAGEGRNERILPGILRTTKFISLVAGVFAVTGITALIVATMVAGLPWGRAAPHALMLFTSAFDTAGFAPQSYSVAYYHSASVEVVLIVLMLAGAFSPIVHYQLWRRTRMELIRNLETRTLAAAYVASCTLLLFGLGRSGAFTDAYPMLRKGVFTLISAQTTSGLSVTPGRLIVVDWGLIAPAVLVGAMAIGGMASSTAGGIKAIRLGIAWKSLIKDVRRVLLPDAALVVETYHSQRRQILRDSQVRAAVTILLLALTSYIGGGLMGLFHGYEITEALFESTAAASNGGLTVDLTAPGMPVSLKTTYLLQMWAGRLEYMAVFALFGTAVATLRGRR